MVMECPICSKVLNNEEICPYCGTNINEDIFVDFTSFQKLKNSFSGTFGKGLSKSDKKDLNEFLLNNESKIADFISKYQSSFENLVLDIPAIKEENKSIYEMICKLTDYFEEKKFNLSINQRKSCYTFKRIYDELADIIPKKNNEYCINTFDSIKLNLEKLNDFFSVSIPNERISKDKLSYKNQFKDNYDLIKPIKDYALNNSDVFNESQEEIISNFISNFDNFNQNVDDLNNNYDMDQKLNLIIKLSSEISRSNNLDELLKEKENYKGLYNLAIEMLDDNESFYYLKNKIELNRNNLHNFKKAYKKLNSKIKLLRSENWIKDNFNILESIKNYETKFPKEFIDNFKFKELCSDFKMVLVNVDCILNKGINISNQYKNLLNDFIKYYMKFPYIVEESNCYFKINSKTANFNNIEHFKSEILHKFENNLSFKYDCIKNDYELLDNKLDDAIYVDDNWSNLVYFNGLKKSSSIKITDKKSFEKKYADLNEKVINVQEFITDDNKIDLDNFIFNFSHIAEYIDEINFHYELNSYLIKINKIEQVCELDDLVNQLLEFKEAYIYSKDAIANFSKWLSKKNEELLIDFIDYYDSLDAKIQEKRKEQIKKWLNDNRSDFVRFNTLRDSEITGHLDAGVIRADYRQLYDDCLDLDWDLLDICDWELVDEFRSNYECIEAIVSYLNNRFDINGFLGSVSGFVLGSSVDVLEKQKEDFKVFFDKCDSFVSRVSDDLLESEKVRINEFKDVYSSIDGKIYKIKVHNWLDFNKNKLADFNNEMSEEISAFILDDDVEDLKKQTEGLYNKIVEFRDNCPFLSQDEVVSSFVYNFENLDDIIADKNCKFRIKQILNEVNNRDFESGSPEYLEKQKELFSKYYVISKRIIDSFDDKITDSQKDEFLKFIDEYDTLDGKIQQKRKELLKKWLDDNRSDFVRFNALRDSEITGHLDADVIREDYKQLYGACLDLNWDLLDIDDFKLVNEFKSNYEGIDAIVSYLNNRFDINGFLGSVSGFVLGSSVDVLEKQKEDFKVFFDKCDSFVSRVSDDLLESEKVRINEFKDVYSSIDGKIYKIKVHNWLDFNKNKLADFNNEMSEEISAFILDDDVEDLKKQTEGLYNKIVEFRDNCPFLSQDEVVSSFVYNFENLEDIIADKNCKFRIKQILNEVNNRDFESDSPEYLEKQKELFSKYYVFSKRIIDSFDDKITDSQKDEFLNFIEEYGNLDNEICNLRIASFFNKHLKEINEFILFTKGTKKYEISDRNRDDCKKGVNYLYDILLKIRDVFNQNPNIKQNRKNLTLEFIEIYENFENIVQRINYQTWFSNNLNDINNFIGIKSKTITSYIFEEEKDTLKASEDCYNKLNEIVDFHNNVFPSNLDLDIICEFIEDYDNYDDIITRLNVEFFFKDNYEIILWGASLNNVNPFYFIKNEEKERYKISIQKIYSNLTKVKQYCVKKHIFSDDKLDLMEDAIRNYENIDDLVIRWNVSYYLNAVVKKFAKIGEYAPDNYFSHNWKQKLLLWHKNAIPKVKKFKEDYAEYISSEDEKFFEKFYNKPQTFEMDTKQANELYINQELNDNSDLFDDLDGKSLDSQQRNAIVVDEDAVRVIAGAGSGKTFTIQGKVRYLTEKRDVDPSEILAISFSNASVNDLEERIAEPIDIKTFHKVGKDILTQYNQYSRPDTSALKRIIKRYLTKKALKSDDISKKLIEFFSFYINVPPSEEDIKYEGDLLDWQEGVDFSTLKRRFKNKQRETLNNEIVRSYEELYIANFLFIHGINYTYEKIYSYPNKNFEREFNKFKEFLFSFDEEIPDELKNDIAKGLLNLTDICEEYEIKNYFPDFYLNDYNIYIEHFGLNRNCENHLIGGKSSEEYVKEMEWKRKVHKKYETTLIETFSYYQSENRLLTRLAEKLQAQGVEFNEIDYRQVYAILLENKTIKEWEDFIVLLKTFIELFKGNNYDGDKFKEFYEYVDGFKSSFSKDRTIAFLKIVEEIYNDYEAYLLKIKKIDFNDMINKASDCIVKNGLNLPYKYIIVDEYQDTSFTRYNLLRNICDNIGAKIMVVGDDWQSIYSFSGCDVNIFTKFDNFFDVCETRYVEKTYRNSQQLIDASSNFVMKNPDQSRKELKSSKSLECPIKIVKFDNDFDEILKFELIIKNIINQSKFENKKILILGRNNKDIFNLLKNFNVKNEDGKRKFEILGDEDKLRRDKFVKIVYRYNPDVNIEYRTVHQSKGLECDNVILINLKNWRAGFPNKMVDDPVLNFVKRNGDSFSYAEERRLFYVALTRTKNNVYLLAPYFKSSVFIQELENDVNVELLNLENNKLETLKNIEKNGESYAIPTKLKCPVCKTGIVLLESFWNNGKLNRVLKCSHNMAPPFNRCNWKGGYYGSELKDLDDIKHCPNCDGILIKRRRHSDGHPFLGCTNFKETGCRGKSKLEYIGKNCPKCSKPLVKRHNGEDNSLFIGCSGFPKCRHTEPFEEKEMGS
ncbi:UvrD-helicase domain-containing protein [uncultured Methanobrevibacter sp.]|uniref:UvrD-helicase domain-containing protein n=1 Tax=uncultured Methanobrevibacter sp. TaxID=253161 RepID=UPI0025DA1C59|nr:UvrD-helicase domain-containing protein [uncultured Methanobrevibacter sp.]